MGGLPYAGDSEWSIAEQVDKIVESGFDGIDIAWTPILPSAEALRHAHAAGLDFGLICFPTSGEDFRRLTETFLSFAPGPVYLNVQPNVKVFTAEDGARHIREWMTIAEEVELRPLVFETHRDRMTTDLRFTLQLMDAVPEMRLNADLSHFVVGQEFAWPISDDDHALIRRIVERSDMFHGRVASREQVQISISWDYHRPWLDLFLGWWEDGFRLWRERSRLGDELIFVTELGPPMWYAITGPDGEELSDRWDEALQLKHLVREVWSRLEADADSW
jgi:sugar phosphate isomerase/epimerase